MNNKTTNTIAVGIDEIKQANIRLILNSVDDALKQRGYNSATQIVGYLITGDPAYISSFNNARTMIQTVERDEILKELVRSYLENNK